MAYVKVTDAEFAALYGLPMLACVLYFNLLRRMDFSTRMVGGKVAVSWWALREDLHVDHARGRHRDVAGTPTEKAVRNAAESLIDRGLVVDRGGGQRLLFFLPMAASGKVRPNDEGRTYGRHEGQDEGQDEGQAQSQAAQGMRPHEGRHEGQDEGRGVNADEGHTSSFTVLSNSIPRSSSVGLGTPGDDAGPDLSDIPNPPTEPGQWMTWFNRVHDTGYSASNVRDRKALWAVFKRWIAGGLTFEQVGLAVLRAQETARGPISNLALYVDSVLATIQAEAAGKGVGKSERRKQAYRALTGSSERGVIDATAIRVD